MGNGRAHSVMVVVFETVVVVVGALTVVVVWVAPIQEQALEYRTLPEHADAYAGMEVGVAVTWRGTMSKAGSGAASRFSFRATEVTVNVLVTVAIDDLVTVLEDAD